MLTLLGLVIEGLIVRSRSLSMSARGGALPATRAGTDSSLKRSPEVGSDDSTAIRVRVPSTVDFVAAPLARPRSWMSRAARAGKALERDEPAVSVGRTESPEPAFTDDPASLASLPGLTRSGRDELVRRGPRRVPGARSL